MEDVRIGHSLYLCSATNGPIVSLGRIKLYQGFGDLRVKTIFIVIETLSVDILIGTDFLDKYATGSYSTEKQLKLLLSITIAILSTRVSDKLTISTTSMQQEEERPDSNYICKSKNTVKLGVAKQTASKPNSMKKVLSVSRGQELMYF